MERYNAHGKAFHLKPLGGEPPPWNNGHHANRGPKHEGDEPGQYDFAQAWAGIKKHLFKGML